MQRVVKRSLTCMWSLQLFLLSLPPTTQVNWKVQKWNIHHHPHQHLLLPHYLLRNVIIDILPTDFSPNERAMTMRATCLVNIEASKRESAKWTQWLYTYLAQHILWISLDHVQQSVVSMQSHSLDSYKRSSTFSPLQLTGGVFWNQQFMESSSSRYQPQDGRRELMQHIPWKRTLLKYVLLWFNWQRVKTRQRLLEVKHPVWCQKRFRNRFPLCTLSPQKIEIGLATCVHLYEFAGICTFGAQWWSLWELWRGDQVACGGLQLPGRTSAAKEEKTVFWRNRQGSCYVTKTRVHP